MKKNSADRFFALGIVWCVIVAALYITFSFYSAHYNPEYWTATSRETFTIILSCLIGLFLIIGLFGWASDSDYLS